MTTDHVAGEAPGAADAAPSHRGWRRWPLMVVLLFAVLWWPGTRLWYFAWVTTWGGRPDRASDFSVLAVVLPPPGADLSAIHPGLPHQGHQGDALLRDLFTTSHHAVGGYRFRDHRIAIDPELRARLHDALRAPELYAVHGGSKLCGGFHPDYCFTWRAPSGTHHLLLCTGCWEAILIGPAGELYCDLRAAPADELMLLLRRLPPSTPR